ncbi:hypothetical protein SBF1_250004 [Candidatus Desulfosporosinus infrequens]|uniref:Uncharacterized protein n=1 Tax=Candidatus Desulfosporosinus infrequens TaxID=2043169 RepID=A0A2U3KP06_9FIRM|nr:hypothetical protein SBF1_250004 [Candidatus Desulfosporosinus infrequens]
MEEYLQKIISEQNSFCQYLLDDRKATRTFQSYVTDVFLFMSHVNEASHKILIELTR